MDSTNKAHKWITSDFLDSDEKEEIDKLIKLNDSSLDEAFYKNLEFGTGGLRGIMGVGSNRVNRFTIRKATQGISNYIIKSDVDKQKVAVIAYDTRNYSNKFALETARVFVANGIKVYLFSEVTPTPILSFAVRYLEADIGIVITASHNPKEYNGYKVYDRLGGQITLELANHYENEINNLDLFKDIKTVSEEQAVSSNLLYYIDQEVYNAYYCKVIESNKKTVNNSSLSIVYTSIHGSGIRHVKKLFDYRPYNLSVVDAQSSFDGDFPTVKYPNPEEKSALSIAVQMALDENADIVLGTDPDADRLGVAVKHENQYHYLTGNEIGVLLLNEIISNKEISNNDYVVKTIVTSDLGKNIALDKGASVIETLTGFKFIGEKIEELQKKGHNFLFGYEESHGYLKDSFVRDKDALMSSILISDIASKYKNQNKTLIDILDSIYEQYGYYSNNLSSIEYSGIDGMDKMNQVIKSISSKVEIINGLNPYSEIEYVEDYIAGTRLDLEKGMYYQIELPKSKVIKFIYKDNSWIVIRSSGTEPKLKLYFQAVSDSKEKSRILLDSIVNGMIEILENI